MKSGTIGARRSAVIPVAALLAPLLFTLACTPAHGGKRTRGIFVEASLPLASYVRMRGRLDAGRNSKFFFPELRIFDGSGTMVYLGQESVRNARVLERLPNGIGGLKPKPDALQLARILDAVPGFRKRETEILGEHRVSVLSVFLEDCHACTVQENALDGAERRLLDQGVNLLVIRATRP
jgi:hypothetical protein